MLTSNATLAVWTLGIDDAVGVGVLLAGRAVEKCVHSLRHSALLLPAVKRKATGAQNILEGMSDAEKKIRCWWNPDNLAVGDKLYFNSGRSTPASIATTPRPRLAIAAQQRDCRLYQPRLQS